ncbi:MAG TPA: methyltransferase domain-containing protein [Solirubrobacterales bacterium]|nr:methyltransferase domain-containing protein [Solirubrobacterales bacterium]
MDVAVAEQLKEGQRRIWASGDWPGFAPIVQNVADSTVEAIGVEEGHDFLDVATGSGNAAIAAAGRGARVTGLDLVPELIDAARARATDAGFEIEFVVGNAEELPFEDDSFDRVTSIFGAMFAPRHQMAADELVRVCRPGGVIAVTAWTPEGMNGQMFKTLSEHMPPPPEGFMPPAMWGTEDHVRELFSSSGDVDCEKRMATIDFESSAQWMEHCERNLGPIVMAKAALEPQGKWEAARADLDALVQRFNEADDDSMLARAEYLLTKVTLPAA